MMSRLSSYFRISVFDTKKLDTLAERYRPLNVPGPIARDAAIAGHFVPNEAKDAWDCGKRRLFTVRTNFERTLPGRQAPRARGERAEKDYLPMRPFTMVREILPRALSTPVIHTVTVSPTATTSLGCFTKRSASLEMWTRPS